MSSSLISLGLGSPASIAAYILLGLSPNPSAVVPDVEFSERAMFGIGGGRFGPGGGLWGPFVEAPTYYDTLTWALEAEFDGEGNGWTEITDDLLDSMLVSYGISGHEPTDRLADTGSLRTVLDNDETNEVGSLGAYSLAHADKRVGFGFDIRVRLKLQLFSYTRYKFLGRLSFVRSEPGLYGRLVTDVEALDWMDDAAEMDLPDLEAQQDQRPDQLLDTILDALATTKQPAARSFGTGSETYTWSLDGGALNGRVRLREVLHQIAASEGGRIVIKGDDTQGGVLDFEPRQAAVIGDIQYTFDDSVILNDGLEVGDDRKDRVGRIQVIAHPIRVDAAATTVLFSLETTETSVGAGDTTDDLFGPYRDPATNQGATFIGGTGFASPIVQPNTDYTMNSESDGSGTDLTAQFTVSASATGRGVRWTITNNSGQTGYITKLQLQGKGIYRREAMSDQVVGDGVGKTLTIDMPFQNSFNVARSYGKYLAYTLRDFRARARRMRYLASESDELLVQMLLREPGDRIAIRETVTGIDHAFVINRVTLEFQPSGDIWCTYGLAPAAAAQQYWLAGVEGFGNAGVNTYAAP